MICTVTPSGRTPRQVAAAVVIPVHDEAERLDASLRSVHRALDRAAGVATIVVVVLDQCRDQSAAIAQAASRPGDLIVAVAHRNVGLARAAGSSAALEHFANRNLDPTQTWLAHTDADSTVPPWWLARQLRWSRRVDAIAGVVRVDDWSEHPTGTRERFRTTYEGGSLRASLGFGPHPHVHGANLGVRGDAYLRSGGFPDQSCGEDQALWDALQANGETVFSTRRLWVTTSGRRSSRARGGFADALCSASPEPPPLRF